MKRVFLIVLDSFGVGQASDAKSFGDEGASTLKSVASVPNFSAPTLASMGLFNIDDVYNKYKTQNVIGSFGKAQEKSASKDTMSGHWEMAGIISKEKMDTYPNGFPTEVLDKIEKEWGKKALCNKPYSGTEVIKDYGLEHIKTGNPIVYTSADSVFQIACHEDVVPLEKLYEYCRIARKYLHGKFRVGRVIARPFVGTYPNFTRTANRHDYSLTPPRETILNYIKDAGQDVIAVGKINDIFSGNGIMQSYHIESNADGEEKTIEIIKSDFNGFCFVNLVDFDSKYGHRRDPIGYANAVMHFDNSLKEMLKYLKDDDILIITADHGCDPTFKGTDHTREFVPVLISGKNVKQNNNLHIISGFGCLGATICDYLGVKADIEGESFLKDILK